MLALDELAAALARVPGIRCVRMPDPGAAVRGVVLHTCGDPAPEAALLVLCASLDGGLPDSTAIAVREAMVARALAEASPRTAIFAIGDTARWSDAYDRVQWVLGEAFGQVAEHDAFHLADAIATSAGGAVTIEDARRRVVAFSTVPGQPIDEVRRQGILGRQVPEHVERQKWYARLWRTDGVCEFNDGTESTGRLAIAVRAAGEPLGSIWVIGTRQTLNAGAAEVLELSVDTVAACLAHQDHFAARSRGARVQLLAALLGPADPAGPAGQAGSAGQALLAELPGPAVLAALARAPRSAGPAGQASTGRTAGGQAEHDLLDERLADVLSLRAHRVHGSGLAAPLDGRVYALFPATERTRLTSYLTDTVQRTGSLVHWAAVSDVVRHADQLPAARRHVDIVLRLRATSGQPPPQVLDVVYVEQERRNLMLAELADAARDVPQVLDGVISTIAAHDQDNGTAYLTTLRAWFECGGDGTAAATLLHVHPNTFRYRMSRAAALFGLRLDVADERLLLHLQLRLRDLE